MELKDTAKLMASNDYKQRFVAEYMQVKIRLEKLKITVNAFEKGILSFQPICPITILHEQIKVMESYLDVLERRAQVEKISLPMEQR